MWSVAIVVNSMFYLWEQNDRYGKVSIFFHFSQWRAFEWESSSQLNFTQWQLLRCSHLEYELSLPLPPYVVLFWNVFPGISRWKEVLLHCSSSCHVLSFAYYQLLCSCTWCDNDVSSSTLTEHCRNYVTSRTVSPESRVSCLERSRTLLLSFICSPRFIEYWFYFEDTE